MLADFDLAIPAGSSLAIVGQNGAGKTTIAKLLCRLYDPQAGGIEIDGVRLDSFDLDSWRARVAAVFQDFVRFELSLRDNVAPGGVPDEVVKAALAEAGASNLADLDTVLSRGYPGGRDLSGGQWQRIALARALCAVRLGAGLVLLDEPTAAAYRLARHLFDLATTAPAGKEVRVAGIGNRLAQMRRAAWERWYAPVAAARRRSAAWHAVGWAIFGTAYVAAVVFVSTVLRATAGQVILVLAAGSRLSAYVAATVGEIGFLRGIWLDGSIRLAWLEDCAASLEQGGDAQVPKSLHEGIRLEHLSVAYPGTERLVLEDVDLHLKAGFVVALVGENGAGKTTLVKLLCRLYKPTDGRILVDGLDLARMRPVAWRSRLSGAFQHFFRFEFRAHHTVGVGDVPRLDDTPAVTAAVARAGADDVVRQLEAGLETQLGPTWPGGVEISFGQWQKLALARGFMRELPLLLVLDEPTAALDAETEHALFERFAAAARAAGSSARRQSLPDGRITILVSHRFSTVRMADFIVVLDGSRVRESGTHEELMARGGQYAELYRIQASAYR